MHSLASRILPIALLVSCGVANAQLTRGFISGTVQDSVGGAIEGVKIAITNLDTGIGRSTVTNGSGVYRFVAVEPGAYRAEFSKIGFESRQISQLQVGTTQELVLNGTLAISPIATSVQVQEAPPGVDLAKSTPTINRIISAQMVDRLPTIGGTRDVTRLTLLAPAVARVTGNTVYAAGGQRSRNNNFTIDGVDNNDAGVSMPALRIIPEQVAEFQAQTNGFSAEFGRNSGAQISVITRSGTNQFHGEAYDNYAGSWMESLTLAQKRTGVNSIPRYVHNEPGGDIGGRIIRDKTFFFSLIDTTRRRGSPSLNSASPMTIPTAEGLAALSSVPLGPDQSTQSRQAALGALGFLKDIYPQVYNYDSKTTMNINGVPIQVGTTRIPLTNPVTYWTAVNRIDHQLTARDSLSYRMTYDKQDVGNVASNVGFGNRWSANSDIHAQSHALSETHIFSSRVINEFRGSFTRKAFAYVENDPVTSTAVITAAFTIGGTNQFPQGRTQDTMQFQNVATYMTGKHSLKLGGDYRRFRLDDVVGTNTKGTWQFATLADFVNNRATSVTQAVSTASSEPRQNLTSFFFQDDWKLRPDLTVNLGVRYEYNTVPFGLFGATEPQIKAAGVPGPAKADRNNWGPRLGVAYSLNAQTVLRGGYGMVYDQIFLNLLSIAAANPPRVVNDVKNGLDTYNLYPTLPRPTATATFNPLSTFSNFLENTQNPTTHFYSFSIQREFAKTNIVEAGYTGSRSYHQIRQSELNYPTISESDAQKVIAAKNINAIAAVQARRLNPAWGARTIYDTTAGAYYNATYVRFDKRLARGLQFGANYTWSSLMSDNDESLNITNLSDSSPPVPQDYRNFRPEWSRSAFDRPHRFVVFYSYRTPWFTSGIAARAMPRQIFSGWEVSGISEVQSGQPFTVRTGVDSLGNNRSDGARPNYNPAGILLSDPVEGNFRTFTSPMTGGVFVTPMNTLGTPLANSMPLGGNLGRNTLRAPAFVTSNLSVSKTFSINERWKIRVRNDFFNLFNHRNFAPPENRMVAATFGQNTRDQVGDSMRNMLASIKIIF